MAAGSTGLCSRVCARVVTVVNQEPSGSHRTEELSAIANTGSVERRLAALTVLNTRCRSRKGDPRHYLQGRVLRPHGTAERGSPTWYRPFDEGPVIGTGLDDRVNDAGHLGGDRGLRLAPEVGVMPIPGDIALKL